MAKYKIKKTNRFFLSSRGKAYWYEVHKKKLGLFWSRQLYLEDYFINDEEAEKEIKESILIQRIAEEEKKINKDVILESWKGK